MIVCRRAAASLWLYNLRERTSSHMGRDLVRGQALSMSSDCVSTRINRRFGADYISPLRRADRARHAWPRRFDRSPELARTFAPTSSSLPLAARPCQPGIEATPRAECLAQPFLHFLIYRLTKNSTTCSAPMSIKGFSKRASIHRLHRDCDDG
jgi:hypothetical protein